MHAENLHWTDRFHWEHVHGCIWKCVETGKYHFNDEAEQLMEAEYETVGRCEDAAIEYGKTL